MIWNWKAGGMNDGNLEMIEMKEVKGLLAKCIAIHELK
jgi:hypothetical protein